MTYCSLCHARPDEIGRYPGDGWKVEPDLKVLHWDIDEYRILIGDLRFRKFADKQIWNQKSVFGVRYSYGFWIMVFGFRLKQYNPDSCEHITVFSLNWNSLLEYMFKFLFSGLILLRLWYGTFFRNPDSDYHIFFLKKIGSTKYPKNPGCWKTPPEVPLKGDKTCTTNNALTFF